MKKLIIVLLSAIFAITVFVACDNSGKDTNKPQNVDSNHSERDSGSYYDDDWYTSSTQSADQSLSQSAVQSVSQGSSVSYEDEDSADWTPFF